MWIGMRAIPTWAYVVLTFGCVLLTVAVAVSWMAGEKIGTLRLVVGVGGFLVLSGLLWIRDRPDWPHSG
jgi:hypothetical protein